MNETIKKLRDQHGTPSERSQKKLVNYMNESVQEFIRLSPFAVMASSNENGDCDASPRGGLPGFIKVLDEKTLLIPDIKGNRLFQSFENIDSNPKVGIIFFIPGNNWAARVNGTVKMVNEQEVNSIIKQLEVNNPDEGAQLIQGLILTVDEAYRHCPRAMQFSNLWDVDQINQNERTGW